MTPAEANELLYDDALLSKEEGLSVMEWEERLSEEKTLREASAIVGPRVVDALTRIVWQWDRKTAKRKK